MKRVLMITYYFPPIGGPGVYRSLKFCKFLPAQGWQPMVIGGDRHDPDFAPDDTLVQEIPSSVAVHRIGFPQRTIWRQTRDWLFLHHMGRIGNHIGFFLDFPCRFREWSRLAIEAAAQLVQRERPDVVFTSATPFSAVNVGMEMKVRFGIPWVADFRDPWIGNPILMKDFPSWQLARQRRAEACVARHADACVFAHPMVAREFEVRHRLPPGKTYAITNGYDPDDISATDAETCSSSQRVRIIHVGSFYGDYTPMPLRRALECAASHQPKILEQFSLTFVGGCPVEFRDLPGLEVEILPRLPHADAINRMKHANILLAVLPSLMGR
jgi:glycosyltransferase involved in cell wall biosynthesis